VPDRREQKTEGCMTIRNLWHHRQDRAYGFRAPDKLPKGRVLVHNHIKHTVDMPDGLNGFRCWTQAMDAKEELIGCGCGWRGVEHYRVRALGDDNSYTWEELMRAAYDGDDAA
jgi:hypothetical protein